MRDPGPSWCRTRRTDIHGTQHLAACSNHDAYYQNPRYFRGAHCARRFVHWALSHERHTHMQGPSQLSPHVLLARRVPLLAPPKPVSGFADGWASVFIGVSADTYAQVNTYLHSGWWLTYRKRTDCSSVRRCGWR
jgi:hypothetical protein